MRRKAIIDARATNSALAGLPWWAKRLVVIIAIFILSAVVSTYTDSAGGGGRQQDQQQQEEFERNVEKQKQEQCKLARNQGIKLPWC
jgi:hypothetical protein